MAATHKSPVEPQVFDAIVIGSGIGGLAVAALLAKLHGQRVLVLEQHFTPGGFTHSFERQGKFHWDVGLHYVGDMGAGSTGRAVFDYITDGQLGWQQMPEPFEKFVYPDFVFEVYGNPQRFQADLIRQFPQEEGGIRQYFRDVPRAAFWFGAHTMVELLPGWFQRVAKFGIRRWGAIARQTTQQYLDNTFQDDRLKALLASQWADYGLPPSQSCFGIHSLIVTHYFKGGMVSGGWGGGPGPDHHSGD
ncbi:MAG: NAD(P)-binding protein [Leptolyngbyaceae cyanobacterium SM2_3_12]|nr:NAD(P)-binding protein [Leptolyngbyaceae cyanobacterium SM2_3_12]